MYIARKQIWNVYGTQLSISKEESNEEATKIRKSITKKQMKLVQAFGGILLANFIIWLPTAVIVVVLQVVDQVSIPLGIMFQFICVMLCILLYIL